MSGGKIIGDNRPKRILEMGHEEKGRISLFSLGVYYRKSLFNAIRGILSPDKVVPDQRVPVIFLSNNDKVFEERTTFRESRDGVTQDYSYDILCICTITEDGRRQYIIDMSEYDHYFVPEYSKADLKKRGRYMKLTSEGERIVSGVPESVVMKNRIINAVRKFCIYIMNGGEYTDKDIQNAISMTCDLIFGEEYNEEELIRLLYDGVKNILNIDLDDETDQYDNEEVKKCIVYMQESIKEIEDMCEKYRTLTKKLKGVQDNGKGVQKRENLIDNVYIFCEKIIGEIETERVNNEVNLLIKYIDSPEYSDNGLKEKILKLHIKYSGGDGSIDTIDEDIGPMITDLVDLCEKYRSEDANAENNSLIKSLHESITLFYIKKNIIDNEKVDEVLNYICNEDYSQEGLLALLKTHIPGLDNNDNILQGFLEEYKTLCIESLKKEQEDAIKDENYEKAAIIRDRIAKLEAKTEKEA